MTGINQAGYIARDRQLATLKRKPNLERDWFLVKEKVAEHFKNKLKNGIVSLGVVHLPKEYIGKRVKFKIEILNAKRKSN